MEQLIRLDQLVSITSGLPASKRAVHTSDTEPVVVLSPRDFDSRGTYRGPRDDDEQFMQVKPAELRRHAISPTDLLFQAQGPELKPCLPPPDCVETIYVAGSYFLVLRPLEPRDTNLNLFLYRALASSSVQADLLRVAAQMSTGYRTRKSELAALELSRSAYQRRNSIAEMSAALLELQRQRNAAEALEGQLVDALFQPR